MTKSPREGARLPIKILVDTNIWLDYFLGWRDMSQVALRVVGRALELGCTLAYAVTSAKDVYYLVASEHKRLERLEAGMLSEEAIDTVIVPQFRPRKYGIKGKYLASIWVSFARISCHMSRCSKW